MASICKHHALTEEHVKKLTELVEGEIEDKRATLSLDDLSALVELRRVVLAIGGGNGAAAQKPERKPRAKRVTTTPSSTFPITGV